MTQKKAMSINELVCFINHIISLILLTILLIGPENVADFSIKESYLDNVLHDYMFGEFAQKVDRCVADALIVMVVVAIVATCLSRFYKNMNEHLLAHRFLVAGVGTNTLVMPAYLLIDLYLGNRQVTAAGWIVACFVIATFLGLAFVIWGIFVHKIVNEIYVNKTIYRVISVGMVIAVVGSVAYPFITLGAEYQSLKPQRKLIQNRPEGYNEEVGYQIGNYCNGNALYLDGKLYLVRDIHDKDPIKTTDQIWTVDKEGNYELFWSGSEDTDIQWNLYHYDGYLYTSIQVRNTENPYRLIKISLADGSTETLLEPEDHMYYWVIVENQLLYGIYEKDHTCTIYSYDLTKPITPENAVLYDSQINFTVLDRLVLINRYLYNDASEFMWNFGRNGSTRESYEGYVYGVEHWYWPTIRGTLYQYYAEGNTIGKSAIDEDVMQFGIFDGKMYYIKIAETDFEIWCCDTDGQNKSLIGTLPYDENSYCSNISMAEGFTVIRMNNSESKETTFYMMQLDSGEFEILQ